MLTNTGYNLTACHGSLGPVEDWDDRNGTGFCPVCNGIVGADPANPDDPDSPIVSHVHASEG